MAKERVIVTGVTGFIGSNLADRLIREGYAVVGIDNLSYGLRGQVPRGVELHELDIRSADIYPVFQPGDVVFHLAAKNSLPDCQKNPVETVDINVRGTVNVFEAARRAGAKKVIHAESSAIYEERSLGFYALSKKACHEFAAGFHEAFGLTTVGLRYFNVYGPRQDYRRTLPPIMSRFIIDLLQGRPATFFEGDEKNKRDFIHVDDINAFHLLCVTDPRVDNQTFDLGSGISTSVSEVYDIVKKIIGEKIPPVVKPRRTDDPPVSTRADLAAAKKLGWAPHVSLVDGMRGMVEYLKEEIAKGKI